MYFNNNGKLQFTNTLYTSLVKFNSYKKLETTVGEKPVDCSKQLYITFLCDVKRKRKIAVFKFCIPKVDKFGRACSSCKHVWYVISFLLLCTICCVGFVANAVEATGAAKISEHCFCCCSVCRSQYTFTLPSFLWPDTCIIRWTGTPALSYNVTEVALIQWFV